MNTNRFALSRHPHDFSLFVDLLLGDLPDNWRFCSSVTKLLEARISQRCHFVSQLLDCKTETELVSHAYDRHADTA